LSPSDNPTASEEPSDIPTQSEEPSELPTISEEPTDKTYEPTILTDLPTFPESIFADTIVEEEFIPINDGTAEDDSTPNDDVIAKEEFNEEFTSNNDVIVETAEEINPINGARIDDSLSSRMEVERIKQITMEEKFKETNFNPEATKDKVKKSP